MKHKTYQHIKDIIDEQNAIKKIMDKENKEKEVKKIKYKKYWKQLTKKEKEIVRLSWNECEGILAGQVTKSEMKTQEDTLRTSFECYWDCFEFITKKRS